MERAFSSESHTEDKMRYAKIVERDQISCIPTSIHRQSIHFLQLLGNFNLELYISTARKF